MVHVHVLLVVWSNLSFCVRALWMYIYTYMYIVIWTPLSSYGPKLSHFNTGT